MKPLELLDGIFYLIRLAPSLPLQWFPVAVYVILTQRSSAGLFCVVFFFLK